MKTAQQWLETYYPVPANSPAALARPVTHSLRKWEGLRASVLEEHDLYMSPHYRRELITSNDTLVLRISADSCALCEVHLDKLRDRPNCNLCQLAKVRGHACDARTDDEQISPWTAWIKMYDPEPMIADLKRTLEKFPEA